MEANLASSIRYFITFSENFKPLVNTIALPSSHCWSRCRRQGLVEFFHSSLLGMLKGIALWVTSLDRCHCFLGMRKVLVQEMYSVLHVWILCVYKTGKHQGKMTSFSILSNIFLRNHYFSAMHVSEDTNYCHAYSQGLGVGACLLRKTLSDRNTMHPTLEPSFLVLRNAPKENPAVVEAQARGSQACLGSQSSELISMQELKPPWKSLKGLRLLRCSFVFQILSTCAQEWIQNHLWWQPDDIQQAGFKIMRTMSIVRNFWCWSIKNQASAIGRVSSPEKNYFIQTLKAGRIIRYIVRSMISLLFAKQTASIVMAEEIQLVKLSLS